MATRGSDVSDFIPHLRIAPMRASSARLAIERKVEPLASTGRSGCAVATSSHGCHVETLPAPCWDLAMAGEWTGKRKRDEIGDEIGDEMAEIGADHGKTWTFILFLFAAARFVPARQLGCATGCDSPHTPASLDAPPVFAGKRSWCQDVK